MVGPEARQEKRTGFFLVYFGTHSDHTSHTNITRLSHDPCTGGALHEYHMTLVQGALDEYHMTIT